MFQSATFLAAFLAAVVLASSPTGARADNCPRSCDPQQPRDDRGCCLGEQPPPRCVTGTIWSQSLRRCADRCGRGAVWSRHLERCYTPRKAQKRGCPGGRTTGPETAGHCCWPGQRWSPVRSTCEGLPQCPSNMHQFGETCGRGPAGTPRWVESSRGRILEHEVTVGEYRSCIRDGVCSGDGLDSLTLPDGSLSRSSYCTWLAHNGANLPLSCVTYDQASAYCAWVGGRLPTEQEWRAAATNGGTTRYPWGDAAPSCDRVTMLGPSGSGCGRRGPAPVCSVRAGDSAAGACDLVGSVWEWATALGPLHSVMGGGWASHAGHARPLARQLKGTDYRSIVVGFRCVVTDPNLTQRKPTSG